MYSARVFRRKIPSLTSENPITEGDLEWIFARNYEGTEQLRECNNMVEEQEPKKDYCMKSAQKVADWQVLYMDIASGELQGWVSFIG